MNRKKIPYHEIGIPTNMNQVGKSLGFGISLAPNHNARVNRLLQQNGVVQSITLPKKVYHTTFNPIQEMRPNQILYVSYDRFQSIAHGLANMRDKHPFSSMYVYELEPIVKTMSVVMFDTVRRPKNYANQLNIRFDKINPQMVMMYSLLPNANRWKTNLLNQTTHSFVEGSGDNMILGHLLCAGGANGIRNTQDQNELAVCDPSQFFKVSKVSEFNVRELCSYINNASRVVFNKKQMPYGYKFKSNNGVRNDKNREKAILDIVNMLNSENNNVCGF